MVHFWMREHCASPSEMGTLLRVLAENGWKWKVCCVHEGITIEEAWDRLFDLELPDDLFMPNIIEEDDLIEDGWTW